MRLTAPLTTLVLNLDRDTERLARVQAEVGRFAGLAFQRVPGVLAAGLPRLVSEFMRPDRVDGSPATFGVFLAHVKAWEIVAGLPAWALILEDDATLRRPNRLFHIDLPEGAELIFVNRRTDLAAITRQEATEARFHSPAAVLEALRERGTPSWAPGADGYLLSPAGAQKLLAAVRRDGCRGHVDWRLFLSGLAEHRFEGFAPGSRLAERLGNLGPWSAGVVQAHCLAPHVVRAGGFDSSRRREAVVE